MRHGGRPRERYPERGGLPSSPGCPLSFEEVALAPSNSTDRVVIAVEPHMALWTAVAVDSQLRPLAAVRVEVNRDGYRRLQAGCTAGTRLVAAGIDVLDVPAKLGSPR